MRKMKSAATLPIVGVLAIIGVDLIVHCTGVRSRGAGGAVAPPPQVSEKGHTPPVIVGSNMIPINVICLIIDFRAYT